VLSAINNGTKSPMYHLTAIDRYNTIQL